MMMNYEILMFLVYILNAGMEFFYWKKVILEEFFYYAQVLWTRKQTFLAK